MNALKPLHPYLRRHRWSIIFGIVFVLATNLLSPLVPTIIGTAVNFAESRRIDQSGLLTFAIYAVSIASIAACFRFLMRRMLIDVSRDIEYEFRNDVFARLQKLDPAFFDANNTGDLMSRVTNDMDALRMLIGPGVMYSANTVMSLPITLAWMLILDWRLTLIAIIPMVALPPLVKFFGGSMHKYSRLQQDSFGVLTTTAQENLAGIRVVKAYRQEAAEAVKFRARNEDYIEKSLKLAELQATFFPSIRMVVSLGYILLLLVGGYHIINHSLEVGTLLGFILLFAMLVWPLIAAGWVVNLIQRGLASLERIGMILDSQPKVIDPVAYDPVPAGPLSIQINALQFRYEGTNQDQLQDLTLDVSAGRTIGIIGPVGSGKSTLVHLLARFYPVERGMITIGGRDINDWPLHELRRRIAFVFQETFLFSDTIEWNIRFGCSDDTPGERITWAAKAAHVHEDITGFPKTYQTVLGERGVNLSGGQKQRVSIARALGKESDILILDDSLSAVDTHTEEAILRDLREVMKHRTTFIISHRISTIATSDEIIVLERGRITQRGTHEELLAKPGLYATLYRKQLTEQEVESLDAMPEGEEVSP